MAAPSAPSASPCRTCNTACTESYMLFTCLGKCSPEGQLGVCQPCVELFTSLGDMSCPTCHAPALNEPLAFSTNAGGATPEADRAVSEAQARKLRTLRRKSFVERLGTLLRTLNEESDVASVRLLTSSQSRALMAEPVQAAYDRLMSSSVNDLPKRVDPLQGGQRYQASYRDGEVITSAAPSNWLFGDLGLLSFGRAVQLPSPELFNRYRALLCKIKARLVGGAWPQSMRDALRAKARDFPRRHLGLAQDNPTDPYHKEWVILRSSVVEAYLFGVPSEECADVIDTLAGEEAPGLRIPGVMDLAARLLVGSESHALLAEAASDKHATLIEEMTGFSPGISRVKADLGISDSVGHLCGSCVGRLKDREKGVRCQCGLLVFCSRDCYERACVAAVGTWGHQHVARDDGTTRACVVLQAAEERECVVLQTAEERVALRRKAAARRRRRAAKQARQKEAKE